MIWIRCWSGWGATNGAWDPSLAGDEVFVRASHLVAVSRMVPGVSLLTFAINGMALTRYTEGEPEDLFARIRKAEDEN